MVPRQIVPLALALAGALALAAPATARVSHVRKALTPTSKAPRARGSANLVVRGSNGRLGISAKRLRGGSTFQVVVDTVRIGALVTNAAGGGKARFRTSPRGNDQLLG